MKNYHLIKNLIKEDIKKAVAELDSQYGLDNLYGFALGTDDDVRTLFHVACTKQWVAKQILEQNYEGIGYIFVEWIEPGNEDLFLPISSLLNEDANIDEDDSDWDVNRDKRFAAIADALVEIRGEQIFHPNTFLYVGSTDPSDYMEALSMSLVNRINSQQHVTAYMDAMGHHVQ